MAAEKELLPIGTYKGIVREWGTSVSGKKKTPRFEVEVEIVAKETEDGEWEDIEVEGTRRVFSYLSPAAAPITISKLRSMGYMGDKMSELNPKNDGHHDFTGVEVIVRVTEHDPKWGEKWDLGWSRNQPRIDPESLPDFDELDKAFSAAAKKVDEEKAERDKEKTEEKPAKRGKRK